LSKARIGIVTVSDRATAGTYQDLSGPAIRETLQAFLKSPWEECYRLIPDEGPVIEATLRELCDAEGCSLVCEKLLPGFGEQMRTVSLRYVPTAILSRQLAGIRGSSLIVNLPGKPKSIRECLDAVFPAIPYCVDLIGGAYLETDESVVKAFRPKN